ncbi:MAG: 4-hydroxyacetophenone monooxygenase [Mycobacterium sp.]|nr:4-hydroxyacetophenone monooxygenase [Mycobacterium sp.]MDT5202875.1 4-hydroxyacetophenone monooxygenase [Mycobacterium sp.]MDT5309739.1 4-hydroxyacetophenone monooxygenase [Mycobacterium sp.]MDT5343958.1 4-hydroxyacetophenone monooxygenase [Mycobacterium sp.]MDT7736842.1 4-hydroxyacetophenone monooxygenase [Mycobacterium sp.]
MDPDETPIDPAVLADALREANIPTLLMVLVQLTGDQRWLQPPFTPRRAVGLDDNDTGGLEDDLQSQVRAAALEAVMLYNAGELTPHVLAPEQVARMLGVALAEDVPPTYGELLSEELGLATRDVDFSEVEDPGRLSAIVIGSGLSGLCAALKLKSAGVDFTVVEKNSDIGGTWFENTYPGVGVDTPSHLYSFTFAMNSRWSKYFAKGGEVFDYLNQLATTHDLRRRIRFDTEVECAEWDDGTGRWIVHVRHADGSAETLTAHVLISAVGMVNRPSLPPIDGLDHFAGPILHTAQWCSDVALDGQRVGVVGTGASAMQLVPSIADRAGHTIVFQRSKQWALPHPNYHRAVSERVHILFDHVPFYLAWYRLRSFWNFSDRLHAGLQIDPEWPHQDRSINATNDRHRVFLTKYITEQLGDRSDLVDACVPDYPPYGKRPLIDNGWYKMLRRDDVELVTEPVSATTDTSIITAAGHEYPVDVIVMATGFKVLQMLYPMDIRGRSGRTLRGQTWGTDDARAFLGITVPDYPNFFIINGPNTNAGHGGSAIHGTEFQVRYIMQALKYLLLHDVSDVDAKQERYAHYNEALDAALSRTVWSHPGMTTYYRNDAGRIVITNPWPYLEYWHKTLVFDPADFEIRCNGEGLVAASEAHRRGAV